MLSSRDKSASFRGGLQPRPTDVFIALMGVTGAGKSSFISQCCDEYIPIGHNLQACTSTVTVYPCTVDAATTIYLVDTPGFDDTNRSDTEVLRELATWLTDSYTANINLNGIIYLHRISDIRMQGSAKKNLYMFKKLCGNNALKNVILVTTMWDKVSEAEGTARELELTSTPDFWGWMVSQGSKVYRHTGDRVSALRLIQKLVQVKTRVTLELQQQMVDEKKDLGDTDAGKEVQAEIIKERLKAEKMIAEIQEDHKEALQAQDLKAAEALAEVRQDYTSKIAQLDNAFERIKISTEKLIEEKYEKLLKEQLARHEKEMQHLQQEKERHTEELKREKRANENRDRRQKRETADLKKRLERFKGHDKLVKTPTFTANAISDYSLSIHEAGFYFRGPKYTLGQWTSTSRNVGDLSRKEFQVMAMGQDRARIYVTSNGNTRFHYDFGLSYVRLTQKYDASDLNAARQIVLGCNGNYFIQGPDWTRYYLDQPILTATRMKENHMMVDICALGRSGAYVVQLRTGAIFWDLKEQYAGLLRKIEEWVEPGRKRFAALTLSLTNECHIALFKHADDAKATSYSLKAPSGTMAAQWESWVRREVDKD